VTHIYNNQPQNLQVSSVVGFFFQSRLVLVSVTRARTRHRCWARVEGTV
jgi:hypothetical protein